MRGLQVLFGVLLIGILALSVWLTPTPLVLKSLGLSEIGQFLSPLLLVALVLERALEVFVTTLRGPKADDLDNQIETREQRISQLKAQDGTINEDLAAAQTALEEATREKIAYRSQTQGIALWTGLALGLLISALGIRTLGGLVDANVLSKLPTFHADAFRVVDVLLTGGLIAGGSDGIHKLANVYGDFMEAASKRAKG